MKLLFCRRCGDVRALGSDEWARCGCGASGGRYHMDGLNAVIDGDALPIGFANSSIDAAITREDGGIRQGVVRDWKHRFTAFVIPWATPTIARPVQRPRKQEDVWATQSMAPVPCPYQRFTLTGSARGGAWEGRSPSPAVPQRKRRQ